MRHRFATLAALLLIAAASACARHTGACTLIGCNDGVSIELVGALPDSYTVTLYVTGETPRVVRCEPAQECAGFVFFQDVSAREARVVVSGDAGMIVERHLALSYTTSQPNGPDCPPVCRTARASVDL